jgi:hypothetical protein
VASVIPALLINLQVGFSCFRYLYICHPMTAHRHKEYLRTILLATCITLAVILQTIKFILSWFYGLFSVSYLITSVMTGLAILSITVMFALMKVEISKVVSNNLIKLMTVLLCLFVLFLFIVIHLN